MVKAKYEAQLNKLENLMEKHELLYTWDTDAKNVTLTVRPAQVDGEQTSFIEESEDGSSNDAAISFIFKDGEITLITCGKFRVSESLVGKLKNIAKKLHYLYLQVMREEQFLAGMPVPVDNVEYYEDFPEEPDAEELATEF